MRHLLVLGVLLFGCAHKPEAQATAPPPPTPARAPARVAKAPPPAALPACRSDDDCASDRLCIAERCEAITPGQRECLPVAHFDFDESLIKDEDRAPLERSARCLKALPGWHVNIAGHCDERGTEEYNLALGDRRARAVASSLVALGAPADQVRTVSYGELQPLCMAHEEPCWWQNRRAVVAPLSDTAKR